MLVNLAFPHMYIFSLILLYTSLRLVICTSCIPEVTAKHSPNFVSTSGLRGAVNCAKKREKGRLASSQSGNAGQKYLLQDKYFGKSWKRDII